MLAPFAQPKSRFAGAATWTHRRFMGGKGAFWALGIGRADQ